MPDQFLKNCWYVAAWHHEISAKTPLARTLLNEDVVFYRQTDGTPVALEDRCAHRRMPLSNGTVRGDALQCGYHGFTFDCTGQCISIPGQENIPGQAQIRSYPVVEKWRWIWIWMGEPELADEALIPDIWQNESPDWAVSEGDLIHLNGHYQLVVDNLMDGSLGTDDVADIPVETKRDGDAVFMIRWILDRPAAPIYADLGGFKGNVDRWQIMTSKPPAMVVVDMGSALTGTSAQDGDRSQGVELKSFNLITPETDQSCFYFYTHVRNFALADDRVGKRVKDLFRIAFLEDVEVIEAVQRGNQRFPETVKVDAAFDKAPLMARRVLERRVAEEQIVSKKAVE
jgi:phenylpropionate dioxygenase-like ring-hydroxylating dioxygenase large terminal subunit